MEAVKQLGNEIALKDEYIRELECALIFMCKSYNKVCNDGLYVVGAKNNLRIYEIADKDFDKDLAKKAFKRVSGIE